MWITDNATKNPRETKRRPMKYVLGMKPKEVDSSIIGGLLRWLMSKVKIFIMISNVTEKLNQEEDERF